MAFLSGSYNGSLRFVAFIFIRKFVRLCKEKVSDDLKAEIPTLDE